MLRKFFTISLVAGLTLMAPACNNATVGGRCSAKEGPARNASHVLFCVKGRWKATVTIGQAADIVMSTWPGSIEPSTGRYTSPPGSFLQMPALRVTDRAGRPASGATVRMTAPGLFQSGTDSVDVSAGADGIIQPWGVLAVRNRIRGSFVVVATASVDGRELARWTVDVPSRQVQSLRVVSGADQVVVAGSSPAPIVVEALDVFGDPADPATCDISYGGPYARSGERIPLTQVIESNRFIYRLGPMKDADSFRVAVNCVRAHRLIGSVHVEGRVVAGPLADASVTGDDQQVPIGTTFRRLCVVPTDEFGNPVSDTDVGYEVIAGPTGAAGQLRPFVLDGVACAAVDANSTVGEFTVRATIEGLGTYDFTLTNTPPVA